MKNAHLLLGLFSLALVSCDKDSSTDPTRTELITQSNWKYDNAGIDLDKNGTIEFSITSQLDACMLDNYLALSTNGTGTINEGANACPGAPPAANLTWSFSNNENNLVLGGGGIVGISGEFKILALTDAKLTLSKDTTLPTVGSAAIVIDLKH